MKIKKGTAVKILAAMLTILMLVSCMQATVFADNMSTLLNEFKDPQVENNNAGDAFKKAAKQVIQIVQIVAVAVAVVMLIVLAIKYISSAPNDKAEIKKHAVIYVVGAILLFGATGVLGLIQKFAIDITGDTTK